MNTPKLILLYSGHYGVYIPQIASQELSFAQPLTDEEKQDLSSPDNEFYWDTWDDVLNRQIVEHNGTKYNLHQDDDLWAVKEGYYLNEQHELVNSETEQIEED